MHDGDDQPDKNGHKYDGFASRTAPYDDEGAECDFRKGVQNDDIRFENLSQRIAPPKRERDRAAEHHGN